MRLRTTHARRLGWGSTVVKLAMAHRTLTVLLAAIITMELVRGVEEIALLPLFLTEVHGEGTGLAGLTITAYLAADVAVRAPAGWLADRFGRKRMLLLGLALSLIPLPFMLRARHTGVLLLLNAVLGVGAGTAWPAVYAAVADTYGAGRRGLIMGILNTAMLGGLASGPIVGNVLVDRLGFTATFVVCMGLMAGAIVLVAALMQETRGERTWAHSWEATWRGIGLLWRGELLVLALIAVAMTLGMTTILPVLNLFGLHVLGLTLTELALLMLVPAGVAAVALVVLGHAADRYGRKPLLVVGMAAMAVPFLLSPISTNPLVVMAGATVAGLGYAAAVPAWSALLMDRVTAQSDHHGLLFGGVSSVQGLGLTLGPTLGGVLWQYVGPYAPLIAVGTIFAAGCILATFTRDTITVSPRQ
ncbi:MAG: MFS transporter [Ardenticatenia bacterium]|nr:MFS transporter [Ardenticatenia bacterium]